MKKTDCLFDLNIFKHVFALFTLQVLLMFVDYNERNLIIEEAEDGIRRRTLDVLIKSGGIMALR